MYTASPDACFLGDMRGERRAGVGDDELATAIAPRGDDEGLAAADMIGLDDRGGVDCEASAGSNKTTFSPLAADLGFSWA